jgi:hypothetical protein
MKRQTNPAKARLHKKDSRDTYFAFVFATNSFQQEQANDQGGLAPLDRLPRAFTS